MRRMTADVLAAVVTAGSVLVIGCNGGDWVTSVITLTIVQDSATEGDGILSPQGEVAISRMCSDDLVIDLASDDETEVTVAATVTISAGETWAYFDLTVEDDSDPDGTQTATITASAVGWTSGEDSIDIDDDGLD